MIPQHEQKHYIDRARSMNRPQPPKEDIEIPVWVRVLVAIAGVLLICFVFPGCAGVQMADGKWQMADMRFTGSLSYERDGKTVTLSSDGKQVNFDIKGTDRTDGTNRTNGRGAP